jgi:hypothetical protein
VRQPVPTSPKWSTLERSVPRSSGPRTVLDICTSRVLTRLTVPTFAVTRYPLPLTMSMLRNGSTVDEVSPYPPGQRSLMSSISIFKYYAWIHRSVCTALFDLAATRSLIGLSDTPFVRGGLRDSERLMPYMPLQLEKCYY